MRISDWSSDVCSSDLNSLSASQSASLCFASELSGRVYGSFGNSTAVTILPSNRPVPVVTRLGERPNTSRGSTRRVSGHCQVLVTASISAVFSRRRLNVPPDREEHTSELQSLMRISYAVFCLKKKKTN